MSRKVMPVIGAGVLAVAMGGCGGTQPGEAKTAADEAPPKTLTDDTEGRDELRGEVKAAIAAIDRELKALGDQIDTATEGARADIERDMKRLRERRTELDAALRKLDAEANETFREVQREIQQVLRDVGIRGTREEE